MSDYFDSAQSNIDDRKRAALEALAQAGTAGKKAHEDEIARIQAARQQAVQSALAAAAQRGAPQAMNDQLAQQIGSGYDRQADNLRASMASRDAGMQSQTAANDAYFQQAGAAIPAMKARADRQLEDIRAKAAQQEADRQNQVMLQELQLQRAGIENDTASQNASAAAAKKASGGDLSDSQLRTRLVGQARVNADAAPAAVKNLNVFGVKLPQLSETARARSIGVAAGISPARVMGVVSPPKVAAPKPAKVSQPAHRADVTSRVQQHASPNTYDSFLDVVAGRPAEFDNGVQVTPAVAAASSFAAAMSKVDAVPAGSWKSLGVSKDALVKWLRDYYTG